MLTSQNLDYKVPGNIIYVISLILIQIIFKVCLTNLYAVLACMT